MDSKNAYEEVLRLLPEKAVRELCNDLSIGMYQNRDFYYLNNLLERSEDASFYFDTPKIEQAYRGLIGSAYKLFYFLAHHSEKVGSTDIFSIYPDREDDETVSVSEDEESKTKRQIKEEALTQARELGDKLANFIRAYRHKDEPDVDNQDLVWEELDFDEASGNLYYRGLKIPFEEGDKEHGIVAKFFEDKSLRKHSCADIYRVSFFEDYDLGDAKRNRDNLKQAIHRVNSKVKEDFNTQTLLFTLDKEIISVNKDI
jgi:hypothetical protein